MMAWSVRRDSRCPITQPFGVVRESDGSLESCHDSREDARGQMAALYAGEKSLGFIPEALKAVDSPVPKDETAPSDTSDEAV